MDRPPPRIYLSSHQRVTFRADSLHFMMRAHSFGRVLCAPGVRLRRFGTWVEDLQTLRAEERYRIMQSKVYPLVGTIDLGSILSRSVGGSRVAMQMRVDNLQMRRRLKASAPATATAEAPSSLSAPASAPAASLSASASPVGSYSAPAPTSAPTAAPAAAVDLHRVELLESVLRGWLEAAFCVDNLVLRRITFSSSGAVLEKIARQDAVHAVMSLRELKGRFHEGRRCYALFHPGMPEEPLAFIHVGLTTRLADSLKSLDIFKEEEAPSHAMFYSVNSPNPAMRGLSLASHLIREVVRELQQERPSLHTFSTLSPVPDLVAWMHLQNPPNMPLMPGKYWQQIRSVYASAAAPTSTLTSTSTPTPTSTSVTDEEVWRWLLDTLQKPLEWTDEGLREKLREPLLWLAGQYITTPTPTPIPSLLCPVASFHLRNGAELHRLLWLGTTKPKNLKNSLGLMVNYLYPLERLEENRGQFEAGEVVVSGEVGEFLGQKTFQEKVYE